MVREIVQVIEKLVEHYLGSWNCRDKLGTGEPWRVARCWFSVIPALSPARDIFQLITITRCIRHVMLAAFCCSFPLISTSPILIRAAITIFQITAVLIVKLLFCFNTSETAIWCESFHNTFCSYYHPQSAKSETSILFLFHCIRRNCYFRYLTTGEPFRRLFAANPPLFQTVIYSNAPC